MQLIHKVAVQHISISVLMAKELWIPIFFLRCEGVNKEESHIILREILYMQDYLLLLMERTKRHSSP